MKEYDFHVTVLDDGNLLVKSPNYKELGWAEIEPVPKNTYIQGDVIQICCHNPADLELFEDETTYEEK